MKNRRDEKNGKTQESLLAAIVGAAFDEHAHEVANYIASNVPTPMLRHHRLFKTGIKLFGTVAAHSIEDKQVATVAVSLAGLVGKKVQRRARRAGR